MAEGRQTGIDGVHQPEVGQIAGREFRQAGAAFIAAEGAALALQDLDEPAEHEHEPLAGGDLQARRHEHRVVNKMAGSVAARPRQWQRHHIVVQLGFEYQAHVLAPNGHRTAVFAAGLVVEAAAFGEIPRLARISAQRAVASAGLALLNCQEDSERIASGREEVADLTDGGDGIRLRHVERRAVGENTGGMHQADGSIAQRVVVQGAADKAVALEPQRGCGEVDRIFKVACLCLKLVRTEVHALRPHHLRQGSHRPN